MNIIIFGGTGYLGFALNQKLIEHGHKVQLLTRRKNKTKINGYICKTYKPNKLDNLLKSIDVVICANGPSMKNLEIDGISKIKLYKKEINSIIRYSLKNNIKKIIYFSSIHILSNSKNKSQSFINYINSKKKIEEILINIFIKKKIDIKILRLTNIFGYKNINSYVKSKSLIKDFIKQAKLNRNINIKSNINFYRFFFPINLFMNYVLYFIEKKHNGIIYNIGDDKFKHTIYQISKLIKKRFHIIKKRKISIIHNFNKKNKIQKNKIIKFFNTKKIDNNKKIFFEQIDDLIR